MDDSCYHYGCASFTSRQIQRIQYRSSCPDAENKVSMEHILLIFFLKPFIVVPKSAAVHLLKTIVQNAGNASALCPYEVFSDENGTVTVLTPEDCIECGACIDACPQKAISMDD